MIIQWYAKEKYARIFKGGEWIIDINGKSVNTIDKMLRFTKYQRRTAWEKTSWGYEAKLWTVR